MREPLARPQPVQCVLSNISFNIRGLRFDCSGCFEFHSGLALCRCDPIGNLDDMSVRALKVLREVALIAAEDTRHSARLMQHFGISTPLAACHEHNERDEGSRFITVCWPERTSR